MAEYNEQIKVIIADDVAETRDILEKALYFEKDIVVVAKAANGREALQLCKQHQPHVVLMDINMPEMDGIAATEAIVLEVPGTQVIIMSVQSEQEYLRRAMLAGAREYLIKPPDTDELIQSIRHVAKLRPAITWGASGVSEHAPSSKSGEIIAVFSPKGGSGCTVVAANLAVALKLITNKRVALVDGNLAFGDVGVAMNIVANKTIVDLASRVHDLDAQLIADVMVSHTSQVGVLLAPPESQTGEAITPEQMRAVLEGLRDQFAYIVVDTQTSYDDRTLTILDAASRILLLMTLELPAIKNVKQFLELAAPLGYPQEKLMLVLNKSDSRFGIRVDNIEGQLRHKVAAQIGNAPREVTLSLNQGMPLVFDRRNHPVGQDIMTLAALVAGSLSPTPLPSAEQVPMSAVPVSAVEEMTVVERVFKRFRARFSW
jgi:pilus assembly protein CpaE